MARPKERTVLQLGQAYNDRCSREKVRLKTSLCKQMNKDIVRMFEEQIHADLIIKVESKCIHVHKFLLQTRSPRTYERLKELSVCDMYENTLTMPGWLDYDTVTKLLRELYQIVSMDSDSEADLCSGGTLTDYLLSFLSDRTSEDNKTEIETVVCNNHLPAAEKRELSPLNETSNKPHELSDLCTSGEKQIMNGMVLDSESIEVSQQKLEDLETDSSQNKTVTQEDGSSQKGNQSHSECSNTTGSHASHDTSQKWAESRTDNSVFSTDNVVKALDNGCDETGMNGENGNLLLTDLDSQSYSNTQNNDPSLPDIIKMTYDISIPYETCNSLAEDLLRGFLQEMNYDCIVKVADVHFKAHKCILASRSSYFDAMLSGSWIESDAQDIRMEGITPAVMEQTLLYLYGGVIDLNESCTVGELVQVADMYGLEGLKDVVLFYLKKDFCHFFHKPCAICESGVVEALQSAIMFNMEDLKEKCLRWVNNEFDKVWRTKAFAKLPSETHEICFNAIMSDLNIRNVLETMLECQKLNRTIPHLKWCEPVLHLVTMLMDATIEFTSKNFKQLLQSAAFSEIDKGLAHKMGLLEELFDMIIRSLPVEGSCDVYRLLSLRSEDGNEIELRSEEYLNFVKTLHSKCEDFLKLHIHQVVNTSEWNNLSKDAQSHLLKNSNFMGIENVPRGRRPPKLSSMQKQISPGLARKINTNNDPQPMKSKITSVNKTTEKKTSTMSKSKVKTQAGSKSNDMLNRKPPPKPLSHTTETRKKTSRPQGSLKDTGKDKEEESIQGSLDEIKNQFSLGLRSLSLAQGSVSSLDHHDSSDSEIIVNIINEDNDTGNGDVDMLLENLTLPVPQHSVVSLLPNLHWIFTKP